MSTPSVALLAILLVVAAIFTGLMLAPLAFGVIFVVVALRRVDGAVQAA